MSLVVHILIVRIPTINSGRLCIALFKSAYYSAIDIFNGVRFVRSSRTAAHLHFDGTS